MVKRRIAFAMAWVVMLTSIPWSGASANAQEYEDAQIIQEEILDEDVAVLEEQPVQNESSGTVSGENSGEEEIILQDNEEIVIESIVETADPSLDEGAEETANGEAAVPQTESAPMSPPGKRQGVTTKLSVEKTSFSLPSSTAPSPSASRAGFLKAGSRTERIRSAVFSPPLP